MFRVVRLRFVAVLGRRWASCSDCLLSSIFFVVFHSCFVLSTSFVRFFVGRWFFLFQLCFCLGTASPAFLRPYLGKSAAWRARCEEPECCLLPEQDRIRWTGESSSIHDNRKTVVCCFALGVHHMMTLEEEKQRNRNRKKSLGLNERRRRHKTGWSSLFNMLHTWLLLVNSRRECENQEQLFEWTN